MGKFRKIITNKKFLLILGLGFYGGLPLALVGGTLKTWLRRDGIDVATIGYFSWVGMAYSLKFAWAPFVDRFYLKGIGRRRTWLLISQLGLVGGFFAISRLNPQNDLSTMAIIAVITAFFSATQDLIIDAHRREFLSDEELPVGSSLYQFGYRIAMLVSGGWGLYAIIDTTAQEPSGFLTWGQMYIVMALIMVGGVLISLFMKEPKVQSAARPSSYETFVAPFAEFLRKRGAWIVLIFVFLFKLGDAIAGQTLNVFYVDMGFTNQQIGAIAKTFGLISSLSGLMVGGVVLTYLGVFRGLFVFGILQGLSTLSFVLITFTGPASWALAFVIFLEDFSSGLGNAAFATYLAQLTDKRYTATQYAALTSVALLGRTFFAGFGGVAVKAVGYPVFFTACALIALPGLLLIFPIEKLKAQFHIAR